MIEPISRFVFRKAENILKKCIKIFNFLRFSPHQPELTGVMEYLSFGVMGKWEF